MPVSFPMVNGVRFDFSSIEFKVGALPPIKGVKEISYSYKKDPGVVYGASAQPLGVTRGQFVGEGSATMYREEYGDFIAALGQGFMEARWGATVMFAEASSPTQTDTLLACLMKGGDSSHSQGNDALVVKFDFFIGMVLVNGFSPIVGAVK